MEKWRIKTNNLLSYSLYQRAIILSLCILNKTIYFRGLKFVLGWVMKRKPRPVISWFWIMR